MKSDCAILEAMKQETYNKLEKIQELLKKKEAIERELENLLGEKTPILPPSFSLNVEVVAVVRESSGALSADDILAALVQKYPAYGLEKKRINSALVYLTNKKHSLERVGRGMYKVK